MIMTQLNAAQRLTTIASTKVEATGIKTSIYLAKKVMPLFEANTIVTKHGGNSQPMDDGAVLNLVGDSAGYYYDRWVKAFKKLCTNVKASTDPHKEGYRGFFKMGGESYTAWISFKRSSVGGGSKGAARLEIKNSAGHTTVLP